MGYPLVETQITDAMGFTSISRVRFEVELPKVQLQPVDFSGGRFWVAHKLHSHRAHVSAEH